MPKGGEHMKRAKWMKLRLARIEKGKTVEDMAKLLNMSAQNYAKKETGDVRFSIEEAKEIAKLLDVPMDILFQETA
jgi:DNA-binding XRE family transcriptional regulator